MSSPGLDWPHPTPSRPMAGVMGWPVDHSLSPVLHDAAARALGLERDYVLLPVPPGEMPAATRRLASDGFAGANVTTPHKDAAFELTSEPTPDAALLRAVNTFEPIEIGSPDSGLRGHNTDAPGFADFLEVEVAFDASGKTALLFGAGGAARACALALVRLGIGTLIVAVRDLARAAGIERVVESAAGSTDLKVTLFDAAAAEHPDLIVNATPLGAGGELLPLPGLTPATTSIDLLYPATTPLHQATVAAGGQAFGGLGLLVHQAAHAFSIWTGSPAPLQAMWSAVKEPSPSSENPEETPPHG